MQWETATVVRNQAGPPCSFCTTKCRREAPFDGCSISFDEHSVRGIRRRRRYSDERSHRFGASPCRIHFIDFIGYILHFAFLAYDGFVRGPILFPSTSPSFHDLGLF
jgi:hypothetical protein